MSSFDTMPFYASISTRLGAVKDQASRLTDELGLTPCGSPTPESSNEQAPPDVTVSDVRRVTHFTGWGLSPVTRLPKVTVEDLAAE